MEIDIMVNRQWFVGIFFLLMGGIFSSCSTGDLVLSGGDLQLTLGSNGQITNLVDSKKHTDYFPEGESASLMSIRVNSEFERPSSLVFNHESNEITLYYKNNDVQAVVNVEEKDSHLVLELISIFPQEKVELVLWGPYPTTINQTVGETVGVVRNEDFAVGIQALNIKTLGGYPSSEDDVDPAYDIFATSSLQDISDSLNVLYRGQTANLPTSGA